MELYQSLRIDSSGMGQLFGGWTQIGPVFSCCTGSEPRRYAVCQCKCGNFHLVHVSTKFRSGGSGGCRFCSTVPGVRKANTRHGLSHLPEYGVWRAMIHRCTDSKCESYKLYGARGISVCERWAESVEAFVQDMGPRPSSKHSIDRIDSNGNYEPDNCRWSDVAKQSRNRRSNRNLTVYGVSRCAADWAKISDTLAATVYARVRAGWTDKEAVFGRPK